MARKHYPISVVRKHMARIMDLVLEGDVVVISERGVACVELKALPTPYRVEKHDDA